MSLPELRDPPLRKRRVPYALYGHWGTKRILDVERPSVPSHALPRFCVSFNGVPLSLLSSSSPLLLQTKMLFRCIRPVSPSLDLRIAPIRVFRISRISADILCIRAKRFDSPRCFELFHGHVGEQ